MLTNQNHNHRTMSHANHILPMTTSPHSNDSILHPTNKIPTPTFHLPFLETIKSPQ